MNSWQIRTRRLLACAVIIGLWFTLTPVGGIAAEGEGEAGISWQASIGYQGMYKDSKWYPARLTLTNETAEALSGDLVVSVLSADNATTDYIVALDLPPGTPVEATVGIPGVRLSKETNQIRFYEGGYKTKNARAVPLAGSDYMISQSTGSYMIGVVSRDPDTLNFMPSLNQRGYSINVVPIDPKELPDDSLLLDSLDALVINDTATADWSGRRVQAIRDWTVKGGTLVLSGGAGYAKTVEAFKDMAPVTPSGTAVLQSPESLAAAGGEAFNTVQGLTVSVGETAAGRVELSEGGIPLAVSRDHGFGAVMYVAFDPSLEPMASWRGSAPLWARLLQNTLSPAAANVIMGMGGGYDNLLWNMKGLIDQFPAIKPPSFGLLLIMFALYVLLVAPLLYVLLAKADRREWGWWLIPSLSVIVGIAVFIVGSGDKRVVSSHTIEIIELAADGNAVVSGGTGIFVPTGGTVTAAFSEEKPLRLYSDNSMMGGFAPNGRYQVIKGGEGDAAVWRSVPYWSTRKLWMDRTVADPSEAGQMTVAYEESGGPVRLGVTNNTAADLSGVHLLIGGQAVRVGDLKRGESGTVALPAAASQSYRGYYSYGHTIYPYSGRGQDEHQRERQLLESYFNSNAGIVGNHNPVLVGFSIDRESKYLVNGDEVRSDNLKMWVQRLNPVQQIGERVIVPAGTLQPMIASNSLAYFNNYGNGILNVGQGEMIVEFLIPDVYSVAYDKLDVRFDGMARSAYLIWSIWHEESGQWVELSGTLGAPKEYLADGQSVRLKLDATGEGDTAMPQIALEGEVLQR